MQHIPHREREIRFQSREPAKIKPRIVAPLLGFAAMICALNSPGLSAKTGKPATNPVASSDAVLRAVEPKSPQPSDLGITFVEGSTTAVIVERNGKKYLVDLASRNVKEVEDPPGQLATMQDPAASPVGRSQAMAKAQQLNQKKRKVYEPGDDNIFSLPTGRRLDRHGFYVNFTHRFAYDNAFVGKARGHVLAGLDGFSISSFGFRYGVTEKLSISAYRSPSVIGRPIQLMGAYNFLDERDGSPLNAALRVSVEGQNDFSRNFVTNLEGVFSRSISRRAQIYVVPTVSLRNRPVVSQQGSLEDPPPDQRCHNSLASGVGNRPDIHPCANTFSLGVGGSLDIRPTVALVAEVIPTLANGRNLGIHRPAYSFGIQKKIWRHAFTFGFSNSPGTTVSQRAGTNATLRQDRSADTPGGLFVGFDLTRQIY